MLNASKPLLPVSVRHAQKRTRRKGSCMRLVIIAAIIFCIGYAVFATRYIGTSKNRREVQDNLIKTQLERSKPTVSVSADGAKHEGRGLKADTQHAPRIPARDHSSLHRINAAVHKAEESARDGSYTGEGSYDDVIARDQERVRHPALHLPDIHLGRDQVQADVRARSPAPQEQHRRAVESGRDDPQARAPHVAPVDHPIGNQHHQHHQPEYRQPQIQHGTQEPQLQPHRSYSSPVLSGPVEADRETELRRQAAVVSPSLAVGSRIEADSHSADRTAGHVREPGAAASPVPVPVQRTPEPTLERPVQVSSPLLVSHLEPDSHQAQRGTEVHQPLISSVPHETDSAAHTGPQHRAPDDDPRAPGITTTAQEPVSAPSPVVHEPVLSAHQPVVTAPVGSPHADTAPQRNPMAKGFYALEAVDIDGGVRPLSEFAGKVTIVVNVASACGYTDENYKGLMKVYEKYKPHGLEILGFPCNQFGNQESGTEAEIRSFCSGHYHVTFPMFSKVDVNGPHTHPVYQFLKRELPEYEGGGAGKGPGQELVWNFQKIFVDHEGRPVKRLYQAWDQNAVESEVYRLLREARQAGFAAARSTA